MVYQTVEDGIYRRCLGFCEKPPESINHPVGNPNPKLIRVFLLAVLLPLPLPWDLRPPLHPGEDRWMVTTRSGRQVEIARGIPSPPTVRVDTSRGRTLGRLTTRRAFARSSSGIWDLINPAKV